MWRKNLQIELKNNWLDFNEREFIFTLTFQRTNKRIGNRESFLDGSVLEREKRKCIEGLIIKILQKQISMNTKYVQYVSAPRKIPPLN
jgi:hypothetical protein